MDRLFVAVIGEQHSGKSTTWNTLFGHRVKTSEYCRPLPLGQGRLTDVFLISGSPEEKRRRVDEMVKDTSCPIVLCSVQYVQVAFERTWAHVFQEGFEIYAQWLNPGHNGVESFDHLGLMNILLSHRAVVSLRSGARANWRLRHRVEEIRQFIHGWAAARGLVR